MKMTRLLDLVEWRDFAIPRMRQCRDSSVGWNGNAEPMRKGRRDLVPSPFLVIMYVPNRGRHLREPFRAVRQ